MNSVPRYWPADYRAKPWHRQAYLWLRLRVVYWLWRLRGGGNPLPDLYPIDDPFLEMLADSTRISVERSAAEIRRRHVNTSGRN